MLMLSYIQGLKPSIQIRLSRCGHRNSFKAVRLYILYPSPTNSQKGEPTLNLATRTIPIR